MSSHAELSAHPSFRQGAIPTGNVPRTIAALFPDLDNLPDDQKVEELIKKKAWLRFPQEGMPELVKKALDTYNDRMVNSMETVREQAKTALTGIQIREQREREKTKPKPAVKQSENTVATTTGGDAPETPVVKGSAPLDDVKPYRDEGEGSEVGATETPLPDSATPSASPEEAKPVQATSANDVPETPAVEPPKTFVAEVETSKRSVVETTQSVTTESSAGSNESDQGSGTPKRSVNTSPESASPPSGTHPIFKDTPPEFKGWRALAAKLIAVVLGLYFGLQISGLIASRSLTVACFVGVLMIMVNEKVGMIRQLRGGKFSKLAKPYSTFIMVTGVSLMLTSLLVNYLMVELQPNWSQPLLDALIR